MQVVGRELRTGERPFTFEAPHVAAHDEQVQRRCRAGMSTLAVSVKSMSPNGSALPMPLCIHGPTTSFVSVRVDSLRAEVEMPLKHLNCSWTRLSYQPVRNIAGVSISG